MHGRTCVVTPYEDQPQRYVKSQTVSFSVTTQHTAVPPYWYTSQFGRVFSLQHNRALLHPSIHPRGPCRID